MTIICTSSFSIVFQFSQSSQMYGTVKLYLNTNYQSPVPPLSLPWPYIFISSFSPMLVFLWSDSELLHGAKPAETHFLFKGWGRDRQACGLGLLYTAVKQHHDWWGKYMLTPNLLSVLVSSLWFIVHVSVQPAASITDIKGNGRSTFRNSKVKFKV